MTDQDQPSNQQPTQKNWFARHKAVAVVLAIIILAIIGSAFGSNGQLSGSGNTSNKSSSSKSTPNTKQYRFADRADKQPKDVEVLPGETATIGGVKMTLSNVQYTPSLSDFDTAADGKTYVAADVSLENTTTRTQPYNVYDFRIQTAGGQVLDNAITSQPTLDSGDLVSGGKARGKVYFEVPIEGGHQYVIWKPGIESDRAIVQVK